MNRLFSHNCNPCHECQVRFETILSFAEIGNFVEIRISFSSIKDLGLKQNLLSGVNLNKEEKKSLIASCAK